MNKDNTAPTSEEHLLLATFLLGNATFGIEAQKVQEIVKVGEITPVHHAPVHVIGIRNLRGRIVTVIDLGIRLNLDRLEPGPESRLLIMEWKNEPVGFLVDQVAEAITIQKDQLAPPPDNLHEVQRKFLYGVYQGGKRLVGVLNTNVLFQMNEEMESQFTGGRSQWR